MNLEVARVLSRGGSYAPPALRAFHFKSAAFGWAVDDPVECTAPQEDPHGRAETVHVYVMHKHTHAPAVADVPLWVEVPQFLENPSFQPPGSKDHL
mmetsp:Transcript_16196/g.41580  ORF Transcript_16196/g.41580 Transcript_16196/m.41580 type:complete len:96 (-) Transcript_16196:241-528(-)